MTILCGTDLSPLAKEAGNVAALMAAKLGERVKLIHVVEAFSPEMELWGTIPDSYPALRAQLQQEAERLRELGAEIDEGVATGVPDEMLVEIAEAEPARLIVLGSLGRRAPARWLLGSVAERTAQTSNVPVLVVRAASALEAWLRGERRLRVMVGVDFTESARRALEWVAELRRLGPCDQIIAHITWPIGEHARRGIEGPVPMDSLHPDLEQALIRELTAHAGDLQAEGHAQLLVRPGVGRVDVHLAALADEEQVDLLVVGSHQRAGLSRVWHGSVSYGALAHARMAVACVPVPSEEPPPVLPMR